MYNQLTPEIIEEIKKVSNNVFLGEEINPDYAKDEMPIYGTHMPDLAVQTRSTEEVAAVMKICYENNIPEHLEELVQVLLVEQFHYMVVF